VWTRHFAAIRLIGYRRNYFFMPQRVAIISWFASQWTPVTGVAQLFDNFIQLLIGIFQF
jgi:hypothetical protein